MDWARLAELGVETYDVYQKQKKRIKTTKSSNPSAVRGGSGTTKRGIRDKYGGYANLALDANKLATEEKGGYKVGGRDSRYERTSSASPDYVSPTIKMDDKWSKKIDIG